jgi:HEXXH motif-containing protein
MLDRRALRMEVLVYLEAAMPRERSLDPPRDLTVPLSGSTTLRDLVSRSLGRLMRELPELLVEGARAAGAAGFREWAGALRQEPGAVLNLLRRPHLGGLVRTLRTSEGPTRSAQLIDLLATLAYEIAAGARPRASLSLETLPSRIVALAARRVVEVPSGSVGRFSTASFESEGGDGAVSVSTPYAVVEEPILFGVADNNPLALLEAHPNKSGNAVDLGGKSVEAWVSALRAALALIRDFVPELRAEMDTCVELIVPVGFDAEQHLSASYAEVPGTLYLSLHPDPMTMAEALLHEFSHTKVNLLSEHDAILENAFEPLFPSPVRPDPRPLWGVLLAVHAFLPVELLYARMAERGHANAGSAGFIERAGAIRKGNEEGLAVLQQNAHPTKVGAALLAELGQWDERFRVRP